MKCGTNSVCVCRDAMGCVPGLLFGWLSFKCVCWLETFPIMCCSPANCSISQPEYRKTNHDSCWILILWFSCCWTWSSASLHAIFVQLPIELEQLCFYLDHSHLHDHSLSLSTLLHCRLKEALFPSVAVWSRATSAPLPFSAFPTLKYPFPKAWVKAVVGFLSIKTRIVWALQDSAPF